MKTDTTTSCMKKTTLNILYFSGNITFIQIVYRQILRKIELGCGLVMSQVDLGLVQLLRT